MTSPEWTLTGETVAKLQQELAEVDEATTADFAAFSRFIGELLSEYRIDPAHDEWATYHGLAFMSLWCSWRATTSRTSHRSRQRRGHSHRPRTCVPSPTPIGSPAP